MSDQEKFEAVKALGTIEAIVNMTIDGWEKTECEKALAKLEKIFEKEGVKSL